MSKTAQCIDVSSYQGAIDWAKVMSASIERAFIKATEGLTLVDSCLAANWSGAKNAGVQRGAYHFARPAEDATQQADWFVDNVLKVGGFAELPPVLDIEDTGGLSESALTSWMQTWLQNVQSRTGMVPMIYCSSNFANKSFDGTQFTEYPLWVADYGVSSPVLPKGWSTWAYWQYGNSDQVNGVTGTVDMNYIAGEGGSNLQILTEGSTGNAVKTLQENLKTLLGLSSSFAVDGEYGPATTAAVKSFQIQNGLTVDGIAGPQTLSKIAAVLKSKQTQSSQSNPQTSTVSVDKAKVQSLVNTLESVLTSAKALL